MNENYSDIYVLTNTPNKIIVEEICDYYIFSGNVPYTITENNSYYCVNESFHIDDQDAITFPSGIHDSILNCQGYNLDGNDVSIGVNLFGTNTTNNIIKNCDITNFAVGIVLDGVNNISLLNNEIQSSSFNGIFSIGSNNIIKNNIVSGSTFDAIWLQLGQYNIIMNNTLNNNGWDGLVMELSSNNTVINNTANGNDDGFTIRTANNTIINNKAVGNDGDGFEAFGKNNILINNTAENNDKNGFFILSLCDNIKLINNTASGNGVGGNYNGFYFEQCDNVVVEDNLAYNNNLANFYLRETNNSNFTNNVLIGSTRGFYVRDSQNNNIKGGSISSGSVDYNFRGAGTTNYFMNNNFTTSKKIYFYDTTSWFNYNNETTGNIWLKTKASTSTTITRELISWSQDLMQWSDTSSSTTTSIYNITGLETDIDYYVFNNSILTYTLNSGPNGEISFTINLPQDEEHEIKVEKSTDFVFWFKFDEGRGVDAYDSSVYSNDGIFYGETFYHGTLGNGTAGYEPTWKSGTDCMYGSCLAFEGTPWVDADVVDVSDIPNGDLTIMAWIYPKQVLGDQRAIVSKWSSAGGTAEWLFRLYNSSSANMRFIMYNTTAGYEQIGSSGANIGTGGWTHVAVSYDISSGQVRFYRNGSYVGGGSFNGPMRDGSAIVKIGSQGYGTLDPFNGTIDEVRIFDEVLSQTEIQYEMNSQFPVSRPIASWKFEENSGTIANDTHIWANGTYGSALSFDGSNDYVQAPHDSSLSGFTEFTAGFWIRQDDVTRRQARLYKWGGGGAQGWFIEGPSFGTWDLGFYASHNGTHYVEWHANYNPIAGSWYYITVVWEANEHAQFYVNGAPVTTSTPPSTISQIYNNVGAPFLVGKCPYDSNRYFDGIIDEIRIWNRTLTQSEIQEEMNRS